MKSTISAPLAPTPKATLFINRNFALLWTGGTISIFGDMIFNTSLVVWISVFLAAQQTWAPLAVSGVMLATLVPTFICGPIAGVFADRWNKRHTMLWMDALRAIFVLILLLATGSVSLPWLSGGHLPLAGQLGAIYCVVFLVSLCGQLFNPSRMALIGTIVPDEHRTQASSLTMISQSVAMIVAPPLAPVILLATGAQTALIINALSFIGSFLLILALRVPDERMQQTQDQQTNVRQEFMAGLRFSINNKVILALIIGESLVMFGASAMNSLDVLFSLDNLHAPASLYGLLSTSLGVGIIIGSILTSILVKRFGLVRTLNYSLLVIALGLLFYSRLTNFNIALGTIFVLGIFMAGINVVAGPLTLRVTPHDHVGRVMALINPASALMQILGATISGYLASTVLLHMHTQILGMTFGPIDTVITGGALITLFGTIISFVLLGTKDPEPVTETNSIA